MGNWNTWLLLGGRGSGKTTAGAAWVHQLANATLPAGGLRCGPIALVGETLSDVREVMIEGPAGIRSSATYSKPRYESTRHRLLWPNGMIAEAISAQDPDKLRGRQYAAVWCDEFCKWRHPKETWDMLQFCLRLGDWPRQLVTTTPKPIAQLKRLMANSDTKTVVMRTSENANNLAPGFLDFLNSRYGGTPLGRQELDGQIIDARKGALWSREQLDNLRVQTSPRLTRIVIAVDPPATSKSTSDACGIVVAGTDEHGHAYVLSDRTMTEAAPLMWAARAIGEYHSWNADLIVAEVNQGGEMVESVLGTVDPKVPVKSVRANRGKYLRAEPVAALYARGKVHHIGAMAELEDEMCDFTVDGLSGGRSPDRLDACVWALNTLLLSNGAEPRIRGTW